MNGTGKFDFVFAWFSVRGGSYHKLIHLHELLKGIGFRSLLLISNDPPYGLNSETDYTAEELYRLREIGVEIKSREEILKIVLSVRSEVFVTDTGEDPNGAEGAVVDAARMGRAKSVQMACLLDDFKYWKSDYLLLQRPFSLWHVIEYFKRRDAADLIECKRIFFTGNIFNEAITNRWTSSIRTKNDFCQKYHLDTRFPICLWMPGRDDGKAEHFPHVMEACKAHQFNLICKLHPWEYKRLMQGKAEGRSVEKWDCEFIEERDSSWAMNFCDVAVAGNTSVGAEMAWWKKPAIYYKTIKTWRTDAVASCSDLITDYEDLKWMLQKAVLMPPPEWAYETGISNLHPNPRISSFQLTIRSLIEVLEQPTERRKIGTSKKLQSMYREDYAHFMKMQGAPKVTWRDKVSKRIHKILDRRDQRRSKRSLRKLESECVNERWRVPMEFQGFGDYKTIKPKQNRFEIKQLFQKVAKLKPSVVCEIGTYRGGTLLLWGYAGTDDALLISLDLFEGGERNAYNRSAVQFLRRILKPTQSTCFFGKDSQFPSTCGEVKSVLKGRSIDFLFIDGDHRYHAVKQDFNLYGPLVRSGGYIAFHDIVKREGASHLEVYKFWEEIKGRYESEEIVGPPDDKDHPIGIGLIRVP